MEVGEEGDYIPIAAGVPRLIDDCLYSAILRSLEQTHCARM